MTYGTTLCLPPVNAVVSHHSLRQAAARPRARPQHHGKARGPVRPVPGIPPRLTDGRKDDMAQQDLLVVVNGAAGSARRSEGARGHGAAAPGGGGIAGVWT